MSNSAHNKNLRIVERAESVYRGAFTEKVDNGGGPPHNGDMEARVAKLEHTVSDMNIRLVGMESRLNQTATKADLSDAKSDLLKEMNTQTWKFITWVTTICILLMSGAFFIAKYIS